MFRSFFPDPKPFFLSAILWTMVVAAAWHAGLRELGDSVGFAGEAEPIVAVRRFYSGPFLWFYLYYWASVGLFALFWYIRRPHRWFFWSVLGSALIIFTVDFSVEVDVALNEWRGPFFDMIQALVSKSRPVAPEEYWSGIWVFLSIALVAVVVGSLTGFFTSHWVFRWRQAMNEFYVANWEHLRTIEGASQRVQEDTMRFAETMQGLASNFISSILTLIAFLPILASLSSLITELPIVGVIPYPLVVAAILWSLFGTVFLALAGIKLPGLYFRNQRVEAAYRKELVYGEDNPARAAPPVLASLFGSVRHNYFVLYFHYMYFLLARILYLQVDAIFTFVLLAPTLLAGAITLGPMQQILSAFGAVSNSFQYLVNSWSTIVELLSIHKRLRAFEATIDGEPLSSIEFTRTDREAADPVKMVT